MSAKNQELVVKMRVLADSLNQDNPVCFRLRTLADALDKEIKGYSGAGNPMPLLGAWARARKLYCELSGE